MKQKSFLAKLNQFRRKATSLLTRQVGRNAGGQNVLAIDRFEIKRILVCRPNHRLGNQLLITPLLQELAEVFPNSEIDLFLKGGLGPTLFKNYKTVNNYFLLPKKHFKQLFQYLKCWLLLKKNHYDIVINVAPNSSSGRLSTQWARANYKIFGIEPEDFDTQYPDFSHFAKKPIYFLRRYFEKIDFYQEENKLFPNLNLILDEDEINSGKKILKQIVNNPKKTIGIYTYATGSKCFAKDRWIAFYEKLKERYGRGYNIVEILPVENLSQIDFQAPHFYSKNIREIASTMRNMEVVISADCGMMHLASASSTATIGLFKFNNCHKYKPYGNKNAAVLTKTLVEDEIFTKIDSSICPKING